jgi:hypothetical protein
MLCQEKGRKESIQHFSSIKGDYWLQSFLISLLSQFDQ